MLVLRVGDPHAKVSNLAELEKLMQFVLETATSKKVTRIEILGDLFHTHAVVRVEVLEFWNRWLHKLSDGFQVIVLVGNHDMTGDYISTSHAMSTFKDRGHLPFLEISSLKIIDEPYIGGGIYAYVPYTHDSGRFIEQANELADRGAKILICHQTFSGSQFENGFFAPDGINADLLRFDTVISGHIHARQRFGKVIYPGTARWDGISDANQPKGLWLVNHDDTTGAIIAEEFVDTSSVCEPISSFTWTEGESMPVLPANGRISVELIGSSNWVSQQKAELKGKVALRSKITDKSVSAVRQSGANFQDFLQNLFVSSFDKERLVSYMKEQGLE